MCKGVFTSTKKRKRKWKRNVKTIKEQESVPVGCVRPACRSYLEVCHASGGGVSTYSHPPWTDRHLWKHYLPETSFTGGNNRQTLKNCFRLHFNLMWMGLYIPVWVRHSAVPVTSVDLVCSSWHLSNIVFEPRDHRFVFQIYELFVQITILHWFQKSCCKLYFHL